MKLQSLLKILKEGYKIWAGFLIYGASFLFAFEVTFIAARRVGFLVLIIPGCLGVLINFLLSKKFPERFSLWKGGFHIVLFFPPYSSFLMSIALFVFVAHFFIPSFQFLWQESLTQAFPSVIKEFALWFIGGPIAIGLIFTPPLLLLYYLTKETQKITSLKLLLVSILSMIIAYSVGMFFDKVGFHVFSEKIIFLVLGFIPIHWFYELFISSVFPIKSVLMLLEKLPKIK